MQGEARATALYTLGRDLTSAMDLQQVADTVIAHIGEVFGREVAIFLPKDGPGGHVRTQRRITCRKRKSWR